jgi:transcriptional regulator with XRE-family HTH domain
MARKKTALRHSTPYAVEQALKRLGANLRTARLRRGLTIEDVAQRIGSGVRAVADAEKGQPGTAGAVYLALLWVYDLLSKVESVADPALDTEGLGRLPQRQRARAGQGGGLSNDF